MEILGNIRKYYEVRSIRKQDVETISSTTVLLVSIPHTPSCVFKSCCEPGVISVTG